MSFKNFEEIKKDLGLSEKSILTQNEVDELIGESVYHFKKKYGLTGDKLIMKFAKLCVNKNYQQDWMLTLKINPYKLMKVQGAGFSRADSLAMAMGFPKDHKFRIISYVSYCLETLSKGSTIIPFSEVSENIQSKLGVSNMPKIIRLITTEKDGSYKLLNKQFRETEDLLDIAYVTRSDWYDIEKRWYKFILKASKIECENVLPKVVDLVVGDKKLNELQKHFMYSFLGNGLNILTGVSGGGKTYTLSTALDLLDKCGQDYVCLTPTGISSKVFSNSTGKFSQTIHKMYFSNVKIDSEWLILDECSMHSVEHINMIMNMCDENNPPKLILIGDVHQLQPISVGDPFYSIIKLVKSGIIRGSIVQLTEIMRASSEIFIPHLCNYFVGDNKYDANCENKPLASVKFEKIEQDLLSQVKNILKSKNYSFKNTLILIPQNIGELGNNYLNLEIDKIYSDGEIFYQDKIKTIRKGSVCINIKNNRELNIFNGERIILKDKINDNFICEKIDDGELVTYSKEEFREHVQLGYCLTVHKTQGITIDNIILVLSNKHRIMLSKNLVYTGMSRASKELNIIYDYGAMKYSHSKKIIDNRITFLGKILENKRVKK